ncbi:hypothetical protein MMC13_004326 [Lambiella insularis]|nr:hypothetical protein [Lambiella insularis]
MNTVQIVGTITILTGVCIGGLVYAYAKYPSYRNHKITKQEQQRAAGLAVRVEPAEPLRTTLPRIDPREIDDWNSWSRPKAVRRCDSLGLESISPTSTLVNVGRE